MRLGFKSRFSDLIIRAVLQIRSKTFLPGHGFSNRIEPNTEVIQL